MGQHLRRLKDFEPFDEIRLKIVPRFKTSGLSGDEWRQNVRCELFFKGEVVAETGWGSMDATLAFLPGYVRDAACPIPSRVIELERTKCCQPSCANDAVSVYEPQRLASRNGEWLELNEYNSGDIRRFCSVHLRRGDCSREDCDDNYKVLEGPGPDGSVNVQESPSARVIVEVDSLGDLPAAVDDVRKGLRDE